MGWLFLLVGLLVKTEVVYLLFVLILKSICILFHCREVLAYALIPMISEGFSLTVDDKPWL